MYKVDVSNSPRAIFVVTALKPTSFRHKKNFVRVRKNIMFFIRNMAGKDIH